MNNCFCELLGLNLDTAYFVAFSYIRALGVHLKTAMQHKTPNEEKSLYNWEVLNCLRVWVHAVAKYPKEGQLGQLILPLTEVIRGLLEFSQASEYFPFHIHLIRLLIVLTEKSNHFIPILKYVTKLLHHAEFQKKKKPSTLKPMDLMLAIKNDKKYAKTNVLWNALFLETLNLG
jgi:nucleolar complex protein 2